MKRRIIKIDETLCNGCGKCAEACHEGAIKMQNGKARLVRDDYCDGLGDCLPACPVGAISFEVREASEYNEALVKAAKESSCKTGGCPGKRAALIEREPLSAPSTKTASQSRLMQWPCQIKLVPTNTPYLDGAKLLIAADCTAYAYAAFHEEFMRSHVTLIGCPKLDAVDYSEKLTEIIKNNDIKSVKVVRMEVPCCAGIVNAVKNALMASGKFIPWQVVIISTDGKILE